MSKVQEFTQLGEVAEITMGQSPDAANYNTDEQGLPFLQGCAEFGKQSPSTNVYCFPPLRNSKPNSILISVRAPVGKTNWGEQSYCIGRGLAGIKARPECADTHFLSYAIHQNISFLHRRSQGSTFLAIGANDLKIFPIPLISYPKQKKISSILGSIDRAIAHTEALIEKYQQIKAGLMHDLFTRGIGADGKLRPLRDEAPELYQESAIGWIPKEWNFVSLGELYAEPARNGLYKPAEYYGKGPLMVQMGNMFRGMCVDFDGASRVQVTDTELGTFGLREGDLLFGRRSLVLEGAGKCSIVTDLPEDSTFESSIIRVRVDRNRIIPDFAAFFLSSAIAYRDRRRFIRQVAVSGVSGADVKQFTMIIPAINEQRIMCNLIQAANSKIKSSEEEARKLEKQKSGLMQDLLTGKVPVNVDANEVDHVSN